MEEIIYIIGDTETTGFGPQAKAVEMAWSQIDDDLNEVNKVYSLIDPEIPICPGASGVHNITAKDVEDSPTIEEFTDVVLGGKIDTPTILIAHNVTFDRPFYDKIFTNIVGQICTLRLARRFFPDAPNHKLQTLKYVLNLKSGEAHRADGDVVTCLDLLSRIVETSSKSLRELSEISGQPLIVANMPFGKHRGEPIASIPASYRLWLRRQEGLDTDLVYTLQQLAREGL